MLWKSPGISFRAGATLGQPRGCRAGCGCPCSAAPAASRVQLQTLWKLSDKDHIIQINNIILIFFLNVHKCYFSIVCKLCNRLFLSLWIIGNWKIFPHLFIIKCICSTSAGKKKSLWWRRIWIRENGHCSEASNHLVNLHNVLFQVLEEYTSRQRWSAGGAGRSWAAHLSLGAKNPPFQPWSNS